MADTFEFTSITVNKDGNKLVLEQRDGSRLEFSMTDTQLSMFLSTVMVILGQLTGRTPAETVAVMEQVVAEVEAEAASGARDG